MESSVQKTGHPAPLVWGSARLPTAHLLSALTILTCLLCTCLEGDLPATDRGDQSWAQHCRARRASCSPFSACLAETSTRLPCLSLTRQGHSLGSLFSEVLSILSSEYVSKEIRTPAQKKTPACAENTHAGSAQVQMGQADSFSKARPRAGKAPHHGLSCWDTLVEVNLWDLRHHLTG